MGEEPSSIVPALKGLILAGGDSSRMGFDKSMINYHGKYQREYLADLLRPFTHQVFLSCRPGQMAGSSIPLIEDAYSEMGPFSAVLSAFQFSPYSAWLVVACDFPLLDHASISQLVTERDPTMMATCFLDEKAQQPEPWITILEPAIYPVLLEYLRLGRSSLRGVLIDHQAKCILPDNPDILLNANTKEEAEELLLKIKEESDDQGGN